MTLRPQYHFRETADGLLTWNVSRLIQLANTLPTVTWPIDQIVELDETYWYDVGDDHPTCRHIVAHMTLVMSANLDYPVLLDCEGRIMDGMHRVCKALYEGRSHIHARQFTQPIAPDFTGVPFNELPDPEVFVPPA